MNPGLTKCLIPKYEIRTQAAKSYKRWRELYTEGTGFTVKNITSFLRVFVIKSLGPPLPLREKKS
jgi:hypothetical protein